MHVDPLRTVQRPRCYVWHTACSTQDKHLHTLKSPITHGTHVASRSPISQQAVKLCTQHQPVRRCFFARMHATRASQFASFVHARTSSLHGHTHRCTDMSNIHSHAPNAYMFPLLTMTTSNHRNTSRRRLGRPCGITSRWWWRVSPIPSTSSHQHSRQRRVSFCMTQPSAVGAMSGSMMSSFGHVLWRQPRAKQMLSR